MPIVAPKVKVVRVTDVPRGDPIIINPSTGQPYPRFGPYVDLGIIDCAAVSQAFFLELIPFTPGQLIEEVYFTLDNHVYQDGANDIAFLTPNTALAAVNSGFKSGAYLAILPGAASVPTDSTGAQIAGFGQQFPDGTGLALGYTMRFRDTGPLYVAVSCFMNFMAAYLTWEANTAYAINDMILKDGFLQFVSTNGVSGSTEPTWNDTPNGTTSDGTVVWTNDGAIASLGTIHAHAVVSSQQLGNDPPRPTSIEFTQQPTDVVAGATMSPAVTVTVLDQNGDVYTALPTYIDLYLLGDGTLSGVFLTQQTTNGVMTFPSISIAEIGTGKKLRAHLDFAVNISVDSDPFNVT